MEVSWDSSSAEREVECGVETSTNYRGSGPDYIAYVFIFLGSTIICLLYKLTLSAQDQVTLQLTASLSDIV
jgi:hypothetical protein